MTSLASRFARPSPLATLACLLLLPAICLCCLSLLLLLAAGSAVCLCCLSLLLLPAVCLCCLSLLLLLAAGSAVCPCCRCWLQALLSVPAAIRTIQNAQAPPEFFSKFLTLPQIISTSLAKQKGNILYKNCTRIAKVTFYKNCTVQFLS